MSVQKGLKWPDAPGELRFEAIERRLNRKRFGVLVDDASPPENLARPLLVEWLREPVVRGCPTRIYCVAEDLDAAHEGHDLIQGTACGNVKAFVGLERGEPTCPICVELLVEARKSKEIEDGKEA